MSHRFEDALAKGVGVANAARARLRGLHGVFVTLTEQHAQAVSLLKRLAAAEPPKQGELWQTVRAELLSHEMAEAEQVYARLDQHPRLKESVKSHERDVPRLEAAIEQVDACALGTDDWRAALEALQYLVEQHVDHEEGEIFPLAVEVIDKPTSTLVDQRFRATHNAALSAFLLH
jgi:hypothetical protein